VTRLRSHRPAPGSHRPAPGAPGPAHPLVDAVAALDPADVLFWSGAGVSAAAPSLLPTGWALTQRVFDTFFEPFTLRTVLAYHDLLDWRILGICPSQPAQTRLPRLETALGAAARLHPGAVPAVLADLLAAPPNRAHRFFAAHLAAGGRHLTANFDRCIEDAHQQRYGHRPAADHVLHFHGALDDPAGGADLGVTLARIERGFPAAERRALTDFLTSGHRAIVIVGYSGSDVVDVDPTVAELPSGALAGIRVIWVAHSESCGWHQPAPVPQRAVFGATGDDHGTAPPLAAHLRRAGAEVTFLCGPTQELLDRLAASWRFGRLSAGPAAGPGGRTGPGGGTPVTTAEQRRAATFLLHRMLGLLPEVERTIGRVGSAVDAEELLIAHSDLLWEQGRYADLRRWWRRNGGPGTTRRAERIGASLWVQGRLVPAYLWLSWHRRRRPTGHPDRDALAETEGRVIEHMTRVPDLAWLGRLLARRATGWLPVADQRRGIHHWRRRTDLRSSLAAAGGGTARPADEASTSATWFAETGNVHAALAFQHRYLRDSYRPEHPSAELASRYRDQFRRAQVVGSVAAAWRILLLPGAARVFATREAVTGAFVPQFAPWHRVRLLGRYAAGRLRWWWSEGRRP
jgi:hypothetical protein